MKNRLNKKVQEIKSTITYVLTNRSGASLWEYLLVIAIVCIIGAALIAVISGDNGIAGIWSGLMERMKSVFQIGGGT